MKRIILAVLLLCSVAMAQPLPSPLGLLTAAEFSDFSSSEHGSGAIGRTIYGGPYYRLTDDIFIFGVAEHRINKTDNGTAEAVSGFAGASWDVVDISKRYEVEAGLLFQGGLTAMDLAGFDPTAKFGWVAGAFIKFPIKNSNAKLNLYGRLVGVADILNPAVGLALAVPFALKK